MEPNIDSKKYIWPGIIALAIILAIIGFVLNGNSKKAGGDLTQTESPTTNNKTILTDFNSVYQTLDINDLDNRPIEINGLLVRKALSDKVILVSIDSKNPTQMYLVGEGFNFKAGQKVNVKATLYKVPDMETIKSSYGLKDADAQDFAKRLIYGKASEVVLSK